MAGCGCASNQQNPSFVHLIRMDATPRNGYDKLPPDTGQAATGQADPHFSCDRVWIRSLPSEPKPEPVMF